MCGIVGCYGFIGPQEKKVFSTLLYLDAYRGLDSTGVCVVEKPTLTDKNKDRTTHVFKEVGGPWNLFKNNDKFERKGDEIKIFGIDTLIGHNRAATWGEVNLDNAHPFEIGEIIGVHNGTLDDYSLKGLPGYDEYSVDSQVLIRRINDEGPEQAFKDIAGAMAVVYYDKGYDTVGIFRNAQRPLWCAFSDDKRTVFWASEEWMLWSAFARVNFKHHMEGTKYFKPNHLYLLDQKDSTVTFADIIKLEECKKSRPIAPPVNRPWTYGGYGSGPGNSLTTQNKNTNSTPPHRPDPVSNYQIELVEKSDDFARGYSNHILTRKMWEEVVKDVGGCIFCKNDLEWSKKNEVTWRKPYEPVCKDCKDISDSFDKEINNA